MTVDAINHDYDTLAGFFPEMADLDQVVRLLSLFAWLKSAEAEGQAMPELESLLALDLPSLVTPRTYPQLLAFNALPPPGEKDRVVVYDRVPVGEALARLGGAGGRPLPARRRYQRAVGALDPSRSEHATLLREFEGYDVERLDASQLDLLAQRAERIRMHETVLGTLDPARRGGLLERMQSGEQLRIFSVGIGGLDLGMGPVVERARGRRAGLATDRAGTSLPGEGATGRDRETGSAGRSTPREAWRGDPVGLPRTELPPHGIGGGDPRGQTVRGVSDPPEPGRAGTPWVLTVYGKDAPEVRSRRVFLDDAQRADRFERFERGRLLRYRFEGEGARLVARAQVGREATVTAATAEGRDLPPGLVLMEIIEVGASPVEPPGVVLRLESSATTRIFEAEFPRRLLQRLVLGREVDRNPGQPLAGLSPLPAALGAVESVMVMPPPASWRPPWEYEHAPRAGEEDAVRLARSLDRWWKGGVGAAPSGVVGVDPVDSPARWSTAPRPGGDALLLLPHGGFDGPRSGWRASLAEAWNGGRVVDRLPDDAGASLVVLVSAEPPASFAARLRALAGDRRMRGRLLAAWCLTGPVREELAGSLLDEGRLAGIGLAESSLVARRGAVRSIAALARDLAGGEAGRRVEARPGPFLWYF